MAAPTIRLRPPPIASTFVCAAAAAWGLYMYGHEMSLIEWNCFDGCSTSDWRPIALFGGIAVTVYFVVLARPIFQQAAPGVAAIMASSAFLLGTFDSFDDFDVTPAGVSEWLIGAGVVLGLGLIYTAVGGYYAIRITAIIPRLFSGDPSTPARAHSWNELDGERLACTVAFRDIHGVRHDVQTELDQKFKNRALIAIYNPQRPHDPAQLRVGIPWRQNHDTPVALWEALKIELPAKEDDLIRHDGSSRAADQRLASQLEHLNELHQTGSLTDEAFIQAQKRVLNQHFSR